MRSITERNCFSHTVRIFAIEYAAHFLNGSQRAAKDNRTAKYLRQGTPYRQTLPPFGEAVHADRSTATTTKVRRSMGHWKVSFGWWSDATYCWLERPMVCSKEAASSYCPTIQSSDPELVKSIVGTPLGSHAWARGARVRLGTTHSQRQNPMFHRQSYFHEVPNTETRNHSDTVLHSTRCRITIIRIHRWRCRCVAPRDGQVDKPHSLGCQERIENAILSEESGEIRRRYQESQRRRDAAGVPLEHRLGRVDELRTAEVAAEPGSQEQRPS